MKRLVVFVSLLLLAGFALPGQAQRGWVPPYGPPLVVMGHDREPATHSRDTADAAPSDNECNEEHHLQPDGDGDCDDPKVGVPEPGALGLMVLGLGGLVAIWRRRR